MSEPESRGIALPGEVALLLHKPNGSYYATANPNIAVAAAEIGELALRNRISIERKHLLVLDPSPSGLPWFDELVAELRRKSGPKEKPVNLANWLSRRTRAFKTHQALLAECGLLVRTTNKFLGFIPYDRHFVHEPTHGSLLNELAQVARAQRPVDNRLALITAVVHAGGLDRALGFGRDERRMMKSIARGESLGGAVEAAVAAASAAITVAAAGAAAAGGGGDGGGGGG